MPDAVAIAAEVVPGIGTLQHSRRVLHQQCAVLGAQGTVGNQKDGKSVLSQMLQGQKNRSRNALWLVDDEHRHAVGQWQTALGHALPPARRQVVDWLANRVIEPSADKEHHLHSNA